MNILKNIINYWSSICIILGAIGAAWTFFYSVGKRNWYMWIPVLLILLGGIGTIGITLDSNEQTAQLEKTLTEKTNEIAKLNGQIVTQSVELLKQSKKIEELSNIILSSVTGGDSYCKVMILHDEVANIMTFLLTVMGKYPIYDINVNIMDLTKLKELPFKDVVPAPGTSKEEWDKMRKTRDLLGEFQTLRRQAEMHFAIPTLTPGSGKEIARIRLPEKAEQQDYLILMFARNGTYGQSISYRRIENQWYTSERLTKTDPKGRTKTLEEVLDPRAPLK